LKVLKQEVQLGSTNNNEAEITMGLEGDDKVYLSIPQANLEDPIDLLAALDGKRMQEEKKQEVEKPKERTIILPDGRKVTVPADAPPGRFRGGRTGTTQEGENAGNGTNTTPSTNDQKQGDQKTESKKEEKPVN